MLEKGRIGTRQLSTLTFMLVVGDMMLIYPSVITSYAKQDAWICALVGIPLGMALMAMIIKLGSMIQGRIWYRLHEVFWAFGREPFSPASTCFSS